MLSFKLLLHLCDINVYFLTVVISGTNKDYIDYLYFTCDSYSTSSVSIMQWFTHALGK